MTRLLPVDIDGLNLVLGGGVAVLKRHPEYDESATLLIRGAPGSGKTIFGVQLAGSIARSLGCDVAYGCVELLPSELSAQHAGIKRPEVSEQVVVAPFPAQRAGEVAPTCRIFAEVLDLGASGEETRRLGDAVERLLKSIEKVGGRPRVLVIDSLSDGYNLGSSAPRGLADALCKMAALRGMILILLEEIIESTPSAWSFAADTVFELRLEGDERPGAPLVRRSSVTKHRFGPCHAGPHRFEINAHQGIAILPAAGAYIASWAPDRVFPRSNLTLPQHGRWSPPAPKDLGTGWPSFSDCVTAVYGSESKDVVAVVSEMGIASTTQFGPDGSDIFLRFNGDHGGPPTSLESHFFLDFGAPSISGEALLARTTTLVRDLLSRGQRIRRVVIGDLQSLRTLQEPNVVRQALTVLVSLLRRAKVPVVMFETSPPRTLGRSWDVTRSFVNEETGAAAPVVVDSADVVIEVVRRVRNSDPGPNVFMTHIQTGRTHEWRLP